MKKYVILFIILLVCSGCEKKELNCYLKTDEDGAITTNQVNYSFDFLGKQQSKEETINITFENQETYQDYLRQATDLYNYYNDESLHYTISNDDKSKTIHLHRNLILNTIDKNSLKELEPSYKIKQKQLSEYYKSIGYKCKNKNSKD